MCVQNATFVLYLNTVYFDYRSQQTYYMFGFLFLVFIILIITCSEATILLCYFHLCAEVRPSVDVVSYTVISIQCFNSSLHISLLYPAPKLCKSDTSFHQMYHEDKDIS